MVIYFEDKVVDFLRTKLTDYNSTNRSGTNWIFPGFPWDLDTTIGDANAFPRVAVETWDVPKELVGAGANSFVESATVGITVFVHHDNVLSVGADTMARQELARQIAKDIEEAFRDNWDTDTNLKAIIHDLRVDRSTGLPPEPVGSAKLYKYETQISLMGVD